MKFSHAVALITGFTVATRGLGFLFRILLSRILGAEMLGVYQIAFSFFMVFMTMIASGLPLIISRQVSSLDDSNKRNKIRGIISSGLVISLVLSVVIITLVFSLQNVLYNIFTDTRSLRILFIFIPAIIATSIYTVLRAIWWGQKKFFLLGVTELSEVVARCLIFFIMLSFAFIFTDLASMAALSFTIACVISALIVVILYWIRSKKEKRELNTLSIDRETYKSHTRDYLKSQLRSASPITAVRVIMSIAFPIIAVIIPLRLVSAGWSSTDAISHFGIAVGMTLPLLSIPQAVISSMSTALVPELSGAMQRRDYALINHQIANCIKITLFINFLLIAPFMAVGPGIGRFLFANEMAGVYLTQSAWIMVPMSISLITNAILNSLGAETRAMVHYIIGSVFLFLCVWFMPQFIGVGALIVGIGICMSIASVLNIILITRLTKSDTKILRLLFGLIFITIPSAFVGHFIFNTIDHVIPLFFSLTFGGGMAFITLLTLAYVFNIVDFNVIRANLSRKRRTKTQETAISN
ncbi:MAG: oligosaccharide flippase family protein [Firmicutes bacterium]|nr:oligosaccharide flippase family protein [Bacillota bacterium]